MYIVHAMPSLNKDVIIIIIIILLLLSVRGEPRSHHLTVTHPSTSRAQRCWTCLSKSSRYSHLASASLLYNSLQEMFYIIMDT